MVKYNNCLAFFKKLRTLCSLWSVDINNNNNCWCIYLRRRIIRLYKHIVRILLLVYESVHKRPYTACNLSKNNVCLLAKLLGNNIYSQSWTKCINIRKCMSHNKHITVIIKNLSQCMSFNTHLNSCILLHLLALATIIKNLLTILDYRLVSASSKSKIHCCLSHIIILRILCRTRSYPHT